MNRLPNQSKYHIMFQKWQHPLIKLQEANTAYEEEQDQEYVLESKKMPTVVDMLGLADFKFYIGHTDFKITKHIIDLIDNTDGVESLEAYTPYRLRISVGKLFDDKTVIANINKKISKYLQLQQTQ